MVKSVTYAYINMIILLSRQVVYNCFVQLLFFSLLALTIVFFSNYLAFFALRAISP